MKTTWVAIGIVIILHLHPGFARATGSSGTGLLTQNNRVNDSNTRLIAKYRIPLTSATASTRLRSLASKFPLRIHSSFKSTPRLVVIETSKLNATQLAEQIRQDPDIEYVERDHAIELLSTSNDTRFTEQWSLKNNELDSDINAEQAWNITTGNKDAVIAIIDSGVAYQHGDLKNNIWTNPGEIANDGIDNDHNGIVDDIHGFDAGDNDADPYDEISHGTYVAGVIGAEGNNGALISGINWKTSILACKVFTSKAGGNSGFLSDVLRCLDYIWDLKQNHGINIIASNNSWGWVGPTSRALSESIEKQKQAGILFIAAAGNKGLNNDDFDNNPASYNNSNVIAVASYNQFLQQSSFSNYGPHTVHISAPGEGILSTSLGTLPGASSIQPDNAALFDGFETDLGNWQFDAYWNVSDAAFAGAQALAFTPGSGGVSSWLTLNPIDLSRLNEPQALDISVAISAPDYRLAIEASNDGVTWNELATVDYQTILPWQTARIPIAQSYNKAGFQLRFTPVYNAADTPNFSIVVDEISIVPASQHSQDNALRYMNGTSMASPAVAAAIALLYAQDHRRNWIQLKNLILAGGKPFDTGSAQTISNRRLRLSDQDGGGSLTCVDQPLQKQLLPKKSYFVFSNATPEINIEYLNIICDKAKGATRVFIKETNESIELLDNGQNGIDQTADDGVYSATINLLQRKLERLTLEFANGESIRAYLSGSYIHDSNIAYQWRDISSPIDLGLNDIRNDPAYVESPFVVFFAGAAFTRLYVSLHGFISFYYPNSAILPNFINTALPSPNFASAIAPLWNDYDNGSASVVYGINGNAPNRELIVQWNVAPFDAASLGANSGLFQLVLFENSSDILFNYQDVIFNLTGYDQGTASTIGVQSSPLVGNLYDPVTHPLGNNSAVIWRYDNGPYLDSAAIINNNDLNNANNASGDGNSGKGGSSGSATVVIGNGEKRLKDHDGYFGRFDPISLFYLLLALALHRRRG